MDSKCTKPGQLETLAPVRPLLSFTNVMERSLLKEHMMACKMTPASGFLQLKAKPEEAQSVTSGGRFARMPRATSPA